MAGRSIDRWPELALADWEDSCDTLHMWTQIVGKIRMMQTEPTNHWWNVPLYLTARGLTTSPVPWKDRTCEISFDFIDHRLEIRTSDGAGDGFDLRPMSVAAFYRAIVKRLEGMDLPVRIRPRPVEVESATPFAEDEDHASYDPEAVRRFWLSLAQADRVLKRFQAGFLGKTSPVHFFWGSFDLASTRFSGRRAPEHPGGIPNLPDWSTREAYSHEVWSGGFWPGKGLGEAAFYAYAYPNPSGFGDADVSRWGGFWSDALGEFVLPWDVVRTAADPDATILGFMQATYDAAADAAGWDRASLDRRDTERERLEQALALPAD